MPWILLEAIFGGNSTHSAHVLWPSKLSLQRPAALLNDLPFRKPNQSVQIYWPRDGIFQRCAVMYVKASKPVMKIHTFRLPPQADIWTSSLPPSCVSFPCAAHREAKSHVRAKPSLEQLKVNKLEIIEPFFPARNAGFLLKCIPLMMVHW